jgi:hypothetical protein
MRVTSTRSGGCRCSACARLSYPRISSSRRRASISFGGGSVVDQTEGAVRPVWRFVPGELVQTADAFGGIITAPSMEKPGTTARSERCGKRDAHDRNALRRVSSCVVS